MFTCMCLCFFQIYYHGEPISVNVHVTNNTNKTVKKIKISGYSTFNILWINLHLVCSKKSLSNNTFVMKRCSASVCRYLSLQHCPVQVPSSDRGIWVCMLHIQYSYSNITQSQVWQSLTALCHLQWHCGSQRYIL